MAVLKILRIFVLPAVILLAGIGGMLTLGGKRPQPGGLPPDATKLEKATVAVQSLDGTLDVVVNGEVVSFRDVQLAAEVSGTLNWKSPLCRPGNFVQKGEKLLEVDKRDFQLEVDRLQRLLEQAKVSQQELDQQIANAKSLIELTGEDVKLQEREVKRLIELGSVISQSERDRAQRTLLTARNGATLLINEVALLNTRRGRLESATALAQVQLDQAKLDFERATVVAPFDGVIAEDSVEAGGFVNRGTALVRLLDRSKVEVRCNLRMEDLYWIWDQVPQDQRSASGKKSAVGYDLPATDATIAYTLVGREEVEYRWKGRLTRFDGLGVEAATRTVPCRVVVDAPSNVTSVSTVTGQPVTASGPRQLVPGMFVRVVTHTRPRSPIVLLPATAVRQPGNQIWRATPVSAAKTASQAAGQQTATDQTDGEAAGSPASRAASLHEGEQVAGLDRVRGITLIRQIDLYDADGQAVSYWKADVSNSDLQAGQLLITTPLSGAQDGTLVISSVLPPDRRQLPQSGDLAKPTADSRTTSPTAAPRAGGTAQ